MWPASKSLSPRTARTSPSVATLKRKARLNLCHPTATHSTTRSATRTQVRVRSGVNDTRVFHDTNCVATFSGQSPAKIPIDVSTCKSSSEFVFYWLALHAQPWQVYINCVALDGTSAASTGSSSNSTSASTTTATTTAPTTTTTPELDEASEGGEASAEEETTEAPVTTSAPETEAPAAEASAPSTSASKCIRRRT
ncbi:hypothetical protein L915_15326 [Phytophthora nicotianae]|uniref:Uncharacterized protein n=1 Tax=Phytophthora nicotianae TaxID=4792 RepID=W2G701_PHYNI|nr:hypothetical protein L915_15326 [Phytophthora nicotianae]